MPIYMEWLRNGYLAIMRFGRARLE
jgi:hypothetical protein